MGIEIYKKEQEHLVEEEKKKTGKVEEKRETLTISDIVSDREKSYLFGKMLEKEGTKTDTELMTRLIKGELEESDIETLEKHRKNFEKRIRQAENIKEELTQELTLEIGYQNPEFQKIINIVGSERAVDIIQGQMSELAIMDPVRFLSISKKIEKVKNFKTGETKRLDDSVKELCEKEKIDANEYLKAIAITDKKQREEAVKKLVQSSWGGVKKTKNSIFSIFGKGLANESVKKLLDKKDEIDNLFSELDKQKKNIGGALSSTIKGNESMRKALSKAIVGESIKQNPQVGVEEARETFPDDEDINTSWENYKKNTNFGGKKWEKLTDPEKDTARTKFGEKLKKDVQDKSKEREGFWNSIFQSLFDPFIDDKINKLK